MASSPLVVRIDVVPVVLELRRVIVAEVIGGFHGQAQLGRWWLPSGLRAAPGVTPRKARRDSGRRLAPPEAPR
jgi:hypothetical protein